MPNLRFEREQLIAADAHIQAAMEHIAAMRLTIESSRGQGFDTSTAEAALAAASASLQVFLEHRLLIGRVIRDIEAGRLPSLPDEGPPAQPPARP